MMTKRRAAPLGIVPQLNTDRARTTMCDHKGPHHLFPSGNPANRMKWVSTTIRRARISSRTACQADEIMGSLSEFPRSKAEFQGWFAGTALAPAESTLPPDGRGGPFIIR